MSFESLTPEQRAALSHLIGEQTKPAETGLVLLLGESIRDVREHDHTTQREDLFCLNLASFMGERMGPALRRLLDLEAEQQTLNEALSDAAEKLRADQDRIAELEAAQGTAFRASHDSIVMGLYTTPAAAREHCEALVRREMPDNSLDWIEDEEDGVAELTVWIGGEETTTGYVVTALEVASAYDPDGDE
ncbi:hypothetical protein [Streptomyces brasiliscabiei]|uniref:hypothetical protein n=1 Tax=Streptomyces brasiliscabiei TaxID=2736302 RepID=UPI0038F7205B